MTKLDPRDRIEDHFKPPAETDTEGWNRKFDELLKMEGEATFGCGHCEDDREYLTVKEWLEHHHASHTGDALIQIIHKPRRRKPHRRDAHNAHT